MYTVGFVLVCLILQLACSRSKHSGLHMITQNGKTGFIDSKGRFVINPQFDRAFRLAVVGGSNL